MNVSIATNCYDVTNEEKRQVKAGSGCNLQLKNEV